MKKFILSTVLLALLFSFIACSNTSEKETEQTPPTNSTQATESTTTKETTTEPETEQAEAGNPLQNKEYVPLEVDTSVDFHAFFEGTCNQYSECIIAFSDYLEKHATEIEVDGKGFSDFDDFESGLDSYYRFLYGMMNSDVSTIPENYKEAWTTFMFTAALNKADLDALYSQKGQELIQASSAMLTNVQTNFASVANSIPAQYDMINIGDKIELDFVEIEIEEYGTSDTITPTDTSRGYSYIADVEKEKYYYITGTLKNLSGNTYDVENILVEFVFDEKYTYSGRLAACAWTNSFYGENVKPLGTVKYYIYASIPEELIDSYSTCKISFGFANEFSVSKYSINESSCDHIYSLTIER